MTNNTLESEHDARATVVTEAAELYLDLLKRCLTNSLHPERDVLPVETSGVRRHLLKLGMMPGWRLVKAYPYDPVKRNEGRDFPINPTAESMVGLKRLDNLHYCVKSVIESGTPGDLIETGVWRGGSSIFMRACLKAYGDTSRVVWVADSFEGLPRPNVEQYPADEGDTYYTYDELRVSLEQVKANFARYGLLDDQVQYLKGWFKDTLPSAPIKKLAVLRLDGDMYESTMDALSALYHRLSVGGTSSSTTTMPFPAARRPLPISVVRTGYWNQSSKSIGLALTGKK